MNKTLIQDWMDYLVSSYGEVHGDWDRNYNEGDYQVTAKPTQQEEQDQEQERETSMQNQSIPELLAPIHKVFSQIMTKLMPVSTTTTTTSQEYIMSITFQSSRR